MSWNLPLTLPDGTRASGTMLSTCGSFWSWDSCPSTFWKFPSTILLVSSLPYHHFLSVSRMPMIWVLELQFSNLFILHLLFSVIYLALCHWAISSMFFPKSSTEFYVSTIIFSLPRPLLALCIPFLQLHVLFSWMQFLLFSLFGLRGFCLNYDWFFMIFLHACYLFHSRSFGLCVCLGLWVHTGGFQQCLMILCFLLLIKSPTP